MEKQWEKSEVKPIKFKQISEDSVDNYKSVESDVGFRDIEAPTNNAQVLKPNFSFEYSYPAVIFDNVCFTIDKSKQQANFMNECLFKLQKCIKPSTDISEQKVEILKSINLSVPYGSIFGLLGPSSCGKTSLLRCLVGLLKPTSGNIRLFCHSSDDYDTDTRGDGACCGCGKKSGDARPSKCKVPGSNVGYMPQDLGLYEDFTIRQLLTMFGRYMKMSSDLIESRIDFMAKFLDLPDVDRQINSLSGGQKRRVSFAIACLHMPPLIILDEPTVGVDPLLRKSIWKYLRRLANEENKTIIITTHYIEEAAQADQVALMRAGEILVQDTPTRIMSSQNCKTLEEAFLKICNNIQQQNGNLPKFQPFKLYPQPRFDWHNKLDNIEDKSTSYELGDQEAVVRELKMKVEQKLGIFDELKKNPLGRFNHEPELSDKINHKFSLEPNIENKILPQSEADCLDNLKEQVATSNKVRSAQHEIKVRSLRGAKMVISNDKQAYFDDLGEDDNNEFGDKFRSKNDKMLRKIKRNLIMFWALLYKNYRRNVNSIPLLAFQFLLPMIQMISFSLCVGGRPTNIGLGLVNHDQPDQLARSHLLTTPDLVTSNASLALADYIDDDPGIFPDELLSLKYLSFIDQSMIVIKPYKNLEDALRDVRQAKLWAAMEIGENFTSTILRRFDLENFYQLDLSTIKQSVIKLYPDRSNKVLDMICHRSLMNSYRKFLLDQFEHFKRLPIEVKEPIFSIKPNLISNSIDGYTESIAAGLLASLTYIMAAGLTTFIMVVERSAGILERTYTSGINPVAYLLVHAVFRSLVMMLQIAAVMFLTFYLLQQPHVGSISLAYLMLMTLNLTGISYGLLISSIVTDQNGAALTIVSSLVVKITLSGILWPFEAIPRWLRTICYIQPLTMPIQALKTITLKGGSLEDRTVQIGFLVSITWMVLFLTIAARRFKFYQY